MPTGSPGCRGDEVEGPFDPDPELKSRFVDRGAAGAGMGAGLSSVGKERGFKRATDKSWSHERNA